MGTLEIIGICIILYIAISIVIAKYLKNRKRTFAKKEDIKTFDRTKVNDYMNDPKFAYMSCNIHNPNSKFYKKTVENIKNNFKTYESNSWTSHHLGNIEAYNLAQMGGVNQLSMTYDIK